MSFADKFQQQDATAIVLNCGLCNKPAEDGHRCYQMRERAFREDAEFTEWLDSYLPYWESEYSGLLHGLHDAYRAGYDEGKDQGKRGADGL